MGAKVYLIIFTLDRVVVVMSDPSSDVGKLESAALARKQRLEKLRAAKEKKSIGEAGKEGDSTSELPR